MGIILALILLIIIIGLLVFLITHKGIGRSSNKLDSVALREATKKLSQNPKDPEALFIIGNYYYQQGKWEDAYKAYNTLTEVGGSSDEFTVYLRWGICALKMGLPDIAHKGLTVARSFKQTDFEVNYYLGKIEFDKQNYEKSVQHLLAARNVSPEDAATLRCLGHAYFKLGKHKEAMVFIRQAMDLAPDDKESLYVLAECYFEANQIEQALKIFSHLRPDPVMGASACLFAGNINLTQRRFDKAIEDFEIGLKHENIKPDVLVELRYRLATTYLRQNDIDKALPLLKQIQTDSPGYKDVPALVSRYQELNANRNLRIFLMGSQADFVALCRKVVLTYYQRAKVKIANISITKNDWADIIAEVDTPRWSDTVAFRFIRTQGVIGELILRDFHSHLKDLKAGKGICITIGSFSEEARRFTEARLIDLIEKSRFIAILNKVDARAAVVQQNMKK